MFETVSQASETNRAESLKDGSDALKAFTEMTQSSVPGVTKGGRTAGGGTGSANGFAKPAMLLSSPAGVGISSQQSLHAAANQQVNLVSGRNVNVAAGKSLLASVMDKISLYAQNLGIKIFATKGPVEIQAQSDALTMLAQQDIMIESASGRMVLRAEKELILNVGGSYIKITPNMIENGTSGQILEKCASWDKPGASTMTLRDPLNGTPVSKHGGYADDFSG